MCGLAGVAGRNLTLKEIKAFKDILYVTSLRGPHSTGVVSVGEDKILMQKLADDSPCFIDYYGGDKGYMMREKQSVLMGHCRWATVGAINTKNAHPFDVGRYIGAHNGTLKDRQYLPEFVGGLTDSEMMFRDMNTKGIKPVLDKLDYWSAYALSIYEKDAKKLYLTRNMDRPLFFAICKKSATVFWASEAREIMFGLMDQGIEADYFKCKADVIYEFDVQNMTHDQMFTEIAVDEKEMPKIYKDQIEWEWSEAAHDFVPKGWKSNLTVVSSTDTVTEVKDGAPF